MPTVASQQRTSGEVHSEQHAGHAIPDDTRSARQSPYIPPVPGCDNRSSPGDPSVGMAGGVNIVPGSDDDGWKVPPPVRLSDGTLVQLYKDGEALHAAYEAIKQAKHRICLEVYIFASDDTGRAFADLLCRKALEGVLVYVVYDSFGSAGSDPAMFEKMRRSGVHLEEFHPIRPWDCRFSWRPFNRDHRKLLIIDYDIAGLGGLNVGAEYAGSWVIRSKSHACDFWRDTAMGIRGPGARMFLRAFARTWHYVNHGGRVARAAFQYNLFPEDSGSDGAGSWQPAAGSGQGAAATADSPSCPPPPASCQLPTDLGVLASVPTLDSPLRLTLRRLFDSARQSIHMTMSYFAPDDELIDALCRAARRGVRVQLMLPHKCDVPILVTAARSFYEKLMLAGVEIYERLAVVLHAKTMVVDGRVSVIGSTNLDDRSIEYNCEISAIVRSEAFGRQVIDLFHHDVRFAQKIHLSQWRRRPFMDRLGQWAVSRARYLL